MIQFEKRENEKNEFKILNLNFKDHPLLDAINN